MTERITDKNSASRNDRLNALRTLLAAIAGCNNLIPSNIGISAREIASLTLWVKYHADL